MRGVDPNWNRPLHRRREKKQINNADRNASHTSDLLSHVRLFVLSCLFVSRLLPVLSAARVARSSRGLPVARAFHSATRVAAHQDTHTDRPNSVPAIAFDIDGVLLRAKQVLPTARSALRKVTSIADGGSHPTGIPHIYLTNGGGVTEAAKAEQLSNYFGIHIRPESVVLSHTPMRDLLPAYRDSTILTLGMTDVRSVAQSYGFKKVLIPADLIAAHPDLVPHLTPHGRKKVFEMSNGTMHALEEIRAILVMHDPNEWYSNLQLVLDLLTLPRDGANHTPPPKIFFSNPDFLFTGRHAHPRLAQGAFRVCLAALYKEFTGRTLDLTLYGKPYGVTYDYGERLLRAQAAALGVDISHFYGIGDNPASDIRGANMAGSHWSSIFVHTGTIARTSHPEEQPTYEHKCVEAAVDSILATAHTQNITKT